MVGAVIIILVLLFLMPFSFFVLGAIVSAVMGWSLQADAKQRYEGSELIDLNK